MRRSEENDSNKRLHKNTLNKKFIQIYNLLTKETHSGAFIIQLFQNTGIGNILGSTLHW